MILVMVGVWLDLGVELDLAKLSGEPPKVFIYFKLLLTTCSTLGIKVNLF